MLIKQIRLFFLLIFRTFQYYFENAYVVLIISQGNALGESGFKVVVDILSNDILL